MSITISDEDRNLFLFTWLIETLRGDTPIRRTARELYVEGARIPQLLHTDGYDSASSGEKRLVDLCCSLWNGSATVNLATLRGLCAADAWIGKRVVDLLAVHLTS